MCVCSAGLYWVGRVCLCVHLCEDMCECVFFWAQEGVPVGASASFCVREDEGGWVPVYLYRVCSV